jgi:hypothetical protein
MNTYANTVKDVSRAVAQLNNFASYTPSQRVDDDYLGQTVDDIAAKVAKEFAYQLSRHPGLPTYGLTVREVRMMLVVHGANPLTIERYSAAIAQIIRSDGRS